MLLTLAMDVWLDGSMVTATRTGAAARCSAPM